MDPATLSLSSPSADCGAEGPAIEGWAQWPMSDEDVQEFMQLSLALSEADLAAGADHAQGHQLPMPPAPSFLDNTYVLDKNYAQDTAAQAQPQPELHDLTGVQPPVQAQLLAGVAADWDQLLTAEGQAQIQALPPCEVQPEPADSASPMAWSAASPAPGASRASSSASNPAASLWPADLLTMPRKALAAEKRRLKALGATDEDIKAISLARRRHKSRGYSAVQRTRMAVAAMAQQEEEQQQRAGSGPTAATPAGRGASPRRTPSQAAREAIQRHAHLASVLSNNEKLRADKQTLIAALTQHCPHVLEEVLAKMTTN